LKGGVKGRVAEQPLEKNSSRGVKNLGSCTPWKGSFLKRKGKLLKGRDDPWSLEKKGKQYLTEEIETTKRKI